MSLINEKRHDLYNYKPSEVDIIIDGLHQNKDNIAREMQKHCPSCKSEKYNFAFDKYSFHYVQCKICMSLYVQNKLSKNETIKYNQELQKKLYSHTNYDKYLNTLINTMSFELELTFSRLFSKKKNLDVAYLGTKGKVYKEVLKEFNANFIQLDLSTKFNEKKYDLIIMLTY